MCLGQEISVGSWGLEISLGSWGLVQLDDTRAVCAAILPGVFLPQAPLCEHTTYNSNSPTQLLV